MSRKPAIKLVVLFLSLAIVATACGKSSKKGSTSATTSPSNIKQGGDLVFGAEQEPDCMDWIASCAGAAWGVYTVQALTMPRAFDFTSQDTYAASPLLTGVPTLSTNPQKVTYHINPKAVWSDGQPITSTDFKYTWDQIANGTDIYDKTGYELISGVDDSDSHTAVVTFKQNFPDWRDLFGGFYGIFPSHILQGKDRDALMKDGYTFSGGPWKLDHWTKGQETKLVPNTAYWGDKPHLNSITFKLETDTAAEQAAYKSNQVSAIYPQAGPGLETLKTVPDTNFSAVSGLSDEGLWFNTAKAPLDSLNVRKALAYATDRDAIVKQLFAPVQPDIKRIDSFFTPAFGAAYTTDFAQYSPVNLTMVTQLMTADGWAKVGGIWTKAGKKAALEIKSTTGNQRRALTEQIVQSEWQAAGFQVTINNESSSVLFGKDLPGGNFQVSLYAQTPTSNDPGDCVIWCSKNIPGPANSNSGENWTRLGLPAIDTPWLAADSELDTTKRLADVKAGNKAIGDNLPGLPVDPFPDVVVYNSSIIGGPVGHNFVFGPWVNSNEWYMK